MTTSLSAGTLTVTGDADADLIAIIGTANPGEFTIQGREGTTVDGGASATIGGVTGNLVIRTGDGDDVVNLDNVYLAGNLTVETQDGNDIVVFGATGVVSAMGDCLVTSDRGNDLFRAEPYKAFFGGVLSVRDLNLDGAANLNGASGAGGVIIQNLSQVFLQGVTSGGEIVVQSVNTLVNNVAIFTSAATDRIRVTIPGGQNSIYIDTCYSPGEIVVQAYSLWPGSGVSHPTVPDFNIDDTITVARCQTAALSIDTAAHPGRRLHLGGNDTVYLYGNYIVGPASPGTFVVTVDTGDGNDAVAASYNVVLGDMRITLADLDDTLTLVGNQITGAIVADGGTGTNRLFLLGNQYPASSFSFFQ